jgi:hypothetical protein
MWPKRKFFKYYNRQYLKLPGGASSVATPDSTVEGAENWAQKNRYCKRKKIDFLHLTNFKLLIQT